MSESSRQIKAGLSERAIGAIQDLSALAQLISTESDTQAELIRTARLFANTEESMKHSEDLILRQTFQSLRELKQQIHYATVSAASIPMVGESLKETLSAFHIQDQGQPALSSVQANQLRND
eukprot:TRINITY_DN5028_c0_g1_i1.p1 TRINITY_DN5028_c0_g1~~TRINITY_DN5028_c0_g1_i1.p1  ORF type:complete len:122 (+),score=22.30 TRINITY_DN5028_c0_g1_i1:47-412(+)